jgi:hypothetical protein
MNAQVQAQVMTLARYYAKQAVKAQYQARGIRWVYVEASELMREANDYLDNHPKLIAFATERYKSFVESGRLKPQRHRRKPSQ